MRKGSRSRLRIIGGEWRSRRLPFVEVSGLRPTPDRVRETLFNWLQGNIVGARCLDLFAGSGAIAFEALSRGAAEVVMVEKHGRVAQQLRDNCQILEGGETSHATVINMDALKFLAQSPAPFDLIFLDPPYRKDLLPPVLEQIIEKNLLNERGMIYLEHESETAFNWQDWNLVVKKTGKAGQVSGFLLTQGAP
ncbi:MAG: 16S rRNA (guanine(966)-N(2))-methyltransferase RsmD [Proteobacteria bacterium]|nr:MAG: 16S rRNA (guanine(966)-N(2))-methyltransferase RsmD [Pseudomonadota bacterium]